MNGIGSHWRQAVFTVVLAFCGASCALERPTEPTPLQIFGKGASTILVAPLNLALESPSELDGSTAIVSTALVDYLEAHGKTVHLLDYRRGRAAWLESIRDVRRSGADENFKNGVRAFARRIGSSVEFDALIMPSVYVQNAAIHSDGAARWDGAKQKIAFVGRSRWGIDLPALTTISAASILIFVFDRDGSQLHSKRTGLELIEHMEIQIAKTKGHDTRTWVLTNDIPAIEDSTRVSAAIAHSLFPFLPKGNR